MPDTPEKMARAKDAPDGGETPMMAGRVGRNQLLITPDALDAFPGIKDYKVVVEDGKIVLIPSERPDLEDLYRHIESLNLTEQDIADAVAWARAEMRKEEQAGRVHGCD